MMGKLLWKYLFQYRKIAALLLCWILIFATIFSLYDLQMEAVWYASGICAVITGICAVLHWIHFCRQHKERERFRENLLLVTQELPVPHTFAEEEYLQMITALREENNAIATKYDLAKAETVDYYTTWMHQIKTPISVMRMLLQNEDTAEHRELLAELFRIEQYAEMALYYLRLDGNASDFVFEHCKLDTILRTAVRRYAGQFIRKRIRLEYHPTEVTVLTDAKWLLFIMEQLLSNAVKYTDSGSVTIAVEGEMVSITDTGIGIAEEDLPRIFEKGFTGYNGRSEKKSTGLGLYLCKKTADKLSHTITVRSEVGKGSTFSVDMRTTSAGKPFS